MATKKRVWKAYIYEKDLDLDEIIAKDVIGIPIEATDENELWEILMDLLRDIADELKQHNVICREVERKLYCEERVNEKVLSRREISYIVKEITRPKYYLRPHPQYYIQ
jgi:hypothetical protein